MIAYAIVVYLCMHDTPWLCRHENIGTTSSEKSLSAFCVEDAPNIVLRWQDIHKEVDVTGWDCRKESR
jgi:hypothetical protein